MVANEEYGDEEYVHRLGSLLADYHNEEPPYGAAGLNRSNAEILPELIIGMYEDDPDSLLKIAERLREYAWYEGCGYPEIVKMESS